MYPHESLTFVGGYNSTEIEYLISRSRFFTIIFSSLPTRRQHAA